MILRLGEPIAALRTRMFSVRTSDGVTPFTGALAGADLQLCKAGITPLVNAVGVATNITARGLYKLVLDVSDLDTMGELALEIFKTGVSTMQISLGLVAPFNFYSPRYGATAVTGTLLAASFTSTATSAVADHWKDSLCRFVTGALAGQVRKIAGNSPAGLLTIAPDPFNGAPSNGDIFELINS